MTIAELVVKLGVTGQGEIQSALSKTKSELNQVGEAAKAAGTAISTGLGVVAIAGIAGLGALGKTAFDSAVSFESLTARLAAITGSGKRAAEVLDTVRKVAEPSPFTFDQLATAATQLEAFGLKTEAILPRLANLGAAFGADEEHLKSLVNLFGRLAAGNFPDIEQLSMFGLSKSMFAAQGIKFDAGGSLLSSARDTFDALIKIIDTKYSGMMDYLSGITDTKLATLTDKWQGTLRIIGSKLITILTPFIEYFSSFLDKLTNSGALNMLVDRFMSPMTNMANAFGNGNMQQGLDRLLATIAAFVAEIPAMLEGVFKNVGIMFNNIMNQNRALMADAFPWVKDPKRAAYNEEATLLRRADINQRAAFNQILDPKTPQQYAESARRFKAQMAQLDAQYGYNGNNDIMAGTTWSKMGDRIQTTISKTLEMISGANLPSSATAGVVGFGPYGNIAETAKAESNTDELLLRIAKNTKDSADALTLRRETLGGGTMGAIGLTGAEVGAVNRSYGMFGNGLIPAGTDLERAVRRTIRDEGRRNGQPGVMGRF
jgi:hypothetical protein